MAQLYETVNAIFASIVAIALAVAATPVPQTWTLQDSQLYALRANCPDEPWHGRHLISLPSTNYLGLENFTVNPETPPLRFFPIRLREDDSNYALRGDGVGDDLSRTPYLAAITNNATRTVSLKIVYLPTPLRESFETQTDACPEGYDCTADQWTLNQADDGVYHDFRFGGFKGMWEPLKDVGKDGWHVYWKSNAGAPHPVQFDLIPVIKVDAYVE